jgi:hypothetical protein
MKIYLGGPIDSAKGNPDARHVEAVMAFLEKDVPVDIFCPYCEQARDPKPARECIGRNSRAIWNAEWAVFVWDISQEPSFGSAAEVWDRSQAHGSVVIVGPQPPGIYADVLEQRGVVWVANLYRAVEHIGGMARAAIA